MLGTTRQIVRSLRRIPGFTAVVVVTFALGIGATTALYSVVSHVLLRPLPYPHPERLVQVFTVMPEARISQLAVAHAEYLDYRAETRLMEEVGAWTERPVILTGSGEPAKLTAAQAAAPLWRVLGIEPALGRVLVAGDDVAGAEPVVVLGHALWQSRFGGDPSVVGRALSIDGISRRVVGVMPAGFQFPRPEVQLWLPITLDPTRRDNHHLSVLGRMRPDTTSAMLQPEMDTIVARWAKIFTHAHPFTAVTYEEQLLGSVRRPLALLFGAVALVLLLAAANVAGLLLGRGDSRQRELAVRAAMGAGRRDIMLRLLGESLLLALAGGVLGLVVAKAGLTAILAMEPGTLPRIKEIGLDGGVLVFALGVAVLSGLLAGAVPGWRASRPDLAGVLRGSGERPAAASSRQRLRGALVVAETAVAVILVAGSALLLRSMGALLRVDPGLDPDHVLTAQISLPAARYPDAGRVQGFYDRLLERLGGLPGVHAASLVSSLPMRDPIRMILVGGPWQPPDAEPLGADVVMVTPRFFETLGNRVVRGRELGSSDQAGTARVALLNQTAARALFGERDALGQPLTIRQAEPREPAFEIVGIVRDVPTFGLGTEVRPQVYLALTQAVSGIRGVTRSVSVALKTRGEPTSLAPTLRRAIWELDDQLAVSNLETMEAVVSASLRPQRFQAALLGVFAALALVLAAVGLYGLLAYLVGLRRRELGVRLAVGARPGQLHALVLGQGLRLAGAGVAIGVLGALVAGRLMKGLLYGVGHSDPLSLVVTALVLLATAALAAYLPARRAAAVDPAVTLRGD